MNWTRIHAIAAALATTAFQIATEAHAVPAPAMSPPWLDGRPTLEIVSPAAKWRPAGDGPVRFVRFDAGVGPTYGVLEGDVVHAIAGGLFAAPAPTGWRHALGDVRVLAPLGPELFGRATWAGAGSGPEAEVAHALARLDARQLLGPGDVFAFASAPTVVGRVAGVVVGGLQGRRRSSA